MKTAFGFTVTCPASLRHNIKPPRHRVLLGSKIYIFLEPLHGSKNDFLHFVEYSTYRKMLRMKVLCRNMVNKLAEKNLNLWYSV